ncbi:MAG: hypothetical protein ACT4P7_19490, partial [Gemmatimonadaceae bacterium]
MVLLSLALGFGGCAFTPSGESAGDDDVAPTDGAPATDDGANANTDAVPQSIDAPACPDTDGDGLCNA